MAAPLRKYCGQSRRKFGLASAASTPITGLSATNARDASSPTTPAAQASHNKCCESRPEK